MRAARYLLWLLLVAATTVPAWACQKTPLQHVFVVLFENTNYASVIGNSSAPYFNSLANTYGLATHYYADTHPSIGNYFMLTTGQIITNDDTYHGPTSVDNIVRHLVASGMTWKEYSENIPNVGYYGNGGVGACCDPAGNYYYSQHHNPLSYFSDARDPSQSNNLVDFTQLAADVSNNTLPNYGFIVPNMCDDGHDCALSVSDSWLQQNIGPIINNATVMKNSIFIIVFDESSNDNTNGGGLVYWVVVGSAANIKPSHVSTFSFYQHESTLRTSLERLGLPFNLGAAATAPSMGEFFQ